MGLIRKAIVVGGILFAIPAPPQDGQQSAAISWGYISAAAETVSDFKGFCERKPQVCVTAQYLAGHLEDKAKYGAKMIYEWASEATTEKRKIVQPVQATTIADLIETG